MTFQEAPKDNVSMGSSKSKSYSLTDKKEESDNKNEITNKYFELKQDEVVEETIVKEAHQDIETKPEGDKDSVHNEDETSKPASLKEENIDGEYKKMDIIVPKEEEKDSSSSNSSSSDESVDEPEEDKVDPELSDHDSALPASVEHGNDITNDILQDRHTHTQNVENLLINFDSKKRQGIS